MSNLTATILLGEALSIGDDYGCRVQVFFLVSWSGFLPCVLIILFAEYKFFVLCPDTCFLFCFESWSLLRVMNYFCKILHLRYLAAFWVCLSIISSKFLTFEKNLAIAMLICISYKVRYDEHCVKIVRIRSFSGPYFPYSVRMRENMDQKNSEYRHILRSGIHKKYERKEILDCIQTWPRLETSFMQNFRWLAN